MNLSRMRNGQFLLTCFASDRSDGTSDIIRLAASDVTDLAAASTVDGEGKLMLPAPDTFLPRKSPIDNVFDFIEDKVPVMQS